MRLYDGTETQLPRDEVYFLDKNKFELDTQYIVLCEDQWVGKAVVYRNTDTGTYQLGTWRCKYVVYLYIVVGSALFGLKIRGRIWPNKVGAQLRGPFNMGLT